MASWEPHLSLDPCLVNEVQRAIESLPPSHLLPPEAGEVFENPEECLERLQNFAMSQGFVVVQRSKEVNKRYRTYRALKGRPACS
jgi:hypothetical protein